MTRIALDVHAHLIPILPGRLGTLPGVAWDGEARKLTLDDHAIGLAKLFDPDALIAWMDSHGVARAWVSVPPPAYRQHLDEAAARQWAAYLNDGLAEICARHADRLAPLLHLPLEHPALAAEIAAAVQPGEGDACPAGFAAPSSAGSHVLSEADYGPLWQALDASRAFVFLHPGDCCDERLEPFYLRNLLGNPYETAVAASHLMFGGVLERHPGIRFCLAHGGGCLAAVAGRLQQGADTRRPGLPQAMPAPLALLRGFHADCITHDVQMLEQAARLFGDEHLLFGSDWPFPMGLLEPGKQSTSWRPALRQAIFQARPKR